MSPASNVLSAPVLRPMMPTTGRPRRSWDAWAIEPLLGGQRVMATVDGRGLEVRTSRGRELTDLLPELASMRSLRPMVLDGELVIGGGGPGRRAELRHRLVHSTSHAATVSMVALDLLWLDGHLLTSLPYIERRLLLSGLGLGPATIVTSVPGGGADTVVTAAEHAGLGGVVAKRYDSIYRPGAASSAWLRFRFPITPSLPRSIRR